MSTLVQRIRAFLRSPRGQQFVERGRQQMAKPSNQRRLREFKARMGKRR